MEILLGSASMMIRIRAWLIAIAIAAAVAVPVPPAQAAVYYTPTVYARCASGTIKILNTAGTQYSVYPCTSKYIKPLYVWNALGWGGRCLDSQGYILATWGAGSGWVLMNDRARYSGAKITCESWT